MIGRAGQTALKHAEEELRQKQVQVMIVQVTGRKLNNVTLMLALLEVGVSHNLVEDVKEVLWEMVR